MARPSSGYPAVYPDTTNKTKLTSTVRVTLNTTLAKFHPLNVFHAVSHDLGAIFISNTTSSKTACR